MYRHKMAESDKSALAVEEYRALRATIRERGSVRVLVAMITFVAWAALSVGAQAVPLVPVLALTPLILLTAGFEIVLAIHVGVERIGRYLQVHFETNRPAPPLWEHLSVETLDPKTSRVGADPLFAWVFTAAAIANLIGIGLLAASPSQAADLGGGALEFAVFGLIHAVFLYRVFSARAAAGRQRLADLESFRRAR
jgi:hypothetical protein